MLTLLALKKHCKYTQYLNLLQYTEIHFNPNNVNLTVHRKQYTSAL